MRVLNCLLVIVLVLLQGELWLARDGLWETWRLENEVEARTRENRVLEARNEALEADVVDLKTGLAAVEERARTELGMIAEGESFYLVVPQRPADDID